MIPEDGARDRTKASRLVETLRVLRETLQDATAEERRAALAQALRDELAGTSEDEADRILESAQSQMADAPGASTGSLHRILDALSKAVAGDSAAEPVDLSPRETTAFLLMRELVDFALSYDLAMNALLAEFGVSSGAGTMVRKAFQAETRERFRACIEGRDGAVEALRRTLSESKRFLLDLNRAYQECLGDGSRALLAELDPTKVAEEHKRLLGTDYEATWKAIRQTQSDLIQLSPRELWQRYYLESFRGKLGAHLTARTE